MNRLYEETDIQAIADAIRSKGQLGQMKVSQMATKIGNISTKETVTWHQCPAYEDVQSGVTYKGVKRFIEEVTYNPNDYSSSLIEQYAPPTAVGHNTKPIGKTVDGISYYNEIPNFETPFSSENVAGTLQPLDRLRWINTVTFNVRDLGGWSCDGGTVKYGMLLRGGEPVLGDKSLMVDQIGIKHELQLRGTSEEPRTYSLWGINFSHTTNYVWLSVAESTKPTWKEIFNCVFNTTNKNVPLYFHCAVGADRTGTVAVMLEALLGMSQSDIDKDYELTCFSTGTGTDAQARRRNEDEYKNYISEIKAIPLVGGLSDTFRNRAVSFVLSLGYTIDQINAFRKSMINGNPTDITVTMPTQTITKTLTHGTVDNPATSVTQYQPYEAKLTPDSGYAISNVKVTMGGVDITSQVFSGTKTNLYRKVTKTLSHCTADGKMTVIDGQDFVCQLTADDGYTLDEDAGANIVIMVGGQQIYPIGGELVVRKWVYYPTGNDIGKSYFFGIPAGVSEIKQYPNAVVKAEVGDSITVNCNTQYLEKLEIMEIDYFASEGEFKGHVRTKVQPTSFPFTYTATNEACKCVAFRFKATSESVGEVLAGTVTFN